MVEEDCQMVDIFILVFRFVYDPIKFTLAVVQKTGGNFMVRLNVMKGMPAFLFGLFDGQICFLF